MLDEHSVALQALKDLYRSLGNVIDQLEFGLDSALEGEGLIQEASRYARRAARALKSDPMPYAAAGLILAIMSACGFPGLGGFLGGVAANMRKNSHSRGLT